MARPLKYGEKTSVRSVTMPDSMWENLPNPKSQWVVEAVRQMQEPTKQLAPNGADVVVNLVDPSASIVTRTCPHPENRVKQVAKGLKCTLCGEFV